MTFISMDIMKALYLSLILALGLTACKTAPVQKPEVAPAQQQFLVEKEKQDKPVIALVLGSGGARGYAHIGVLDVLDQYQIKPDFIVGTSAGSLAGSLYASGKTAKQVEELAHLLTINDVREFDLGKQGVFDGQKIEDYVNQHINYQPLEQLKTPLYVVATQLDNGNMTVFNTGNTGQAVRASIAIPTMFAPVKIGEQRYVDGGLVSPVPVKVAQELGADIIIAVNILASPHYTNTEHLWGLFNQNINIMQQQLAKEELKYATIVIQPDIREKQHIFDMKSREYLIKAGRIATLAQVDDIQAEIQRLQLEKNAEATTDMITDTTTNTTADTTTDTSVIDAQE